MRMIRTLHSLEVKFDKPLHGLDPRCNTLKRGAGSIYNFATLKPFSYAKEILSDNAKPLIMIQYNQLH